MVAIMLFLALVPLIAPGEGNERRSACTSATSLGVRAKGKMVSFPLIKTYSQFSSFTIVMFYKVVE